MYSDDRGGVLSDSISHGKANSTLKCPSCESARTAPAPRDAYADRFFVIRRPLVCLDCGFVFDRRPNAVVCLLSAAVIGAASVVVLLHDVVSSLMAICTGEPAMLRHWWHLVGGSVTVITCMWIVSVLIMAVVCPVRVYDRPARPQEEHR